MKIGQRFVALAGAIFLCGTCWTASSAEPPSPDPDDRCAVCGMFVGKYRNWVASVVFADGAQVFFDGPKDLFRYVLDLEKYGADDKVISSIWVKDYYRVQSIDAKSAFFVVGSDVMGPMGRELIPLELRAHAETFVQDHGGGEILDFSGVTLAKIPR